METLSIIQLLFAFGVFTLLNIVIALIIRPSQKQFDETRAENREFIQEFMKLSQKQFDETRAENREFIQEFKTETRESIQEFKTETRESIQEFKTETRESIQEFKTETKESIQEIKGEMRELKADNRDIKRGLDHLMFSLIARTDHELQLSGEIHHPLKKKSERVSG